MALEWLDEIEARANAATPGPLKRAGTFEFNAHTLWDRTLVLEALARPLSDTTDVLYAYRECDAEFHAYAREDVLRLCRAVRELHSALETALELATSHPGIDEESKAARELRRVLERWGRGGD